MVSIKVSAHVGVADHGLCGEGGEESITKSKLNPDTQITTWNSQVHEDGSGHWECSLISHMFLCGELKERNLTLCYVPGPIFRIFKFFFGEKTWGYPVLFFFPNTSICLRWCEGHSCSVCGALVGFLLLPIAVVLAILAFVLSAILIVLFMPVFIVFILPILIVTKCRRGQDSETVMKISEEQRCNDDVFSKVNSRHILSNPSCWCWGSLRYLEYKPSPPVDP